MAIGIIFIYRKSFNYLLKYFTYFNNYQLYVRSREVMAIPSASIHSSGSTSYVSYKANTEYDFGTLACWATNSVGHQKNPCIIHLTLASKLTFKYKILLYRYLNHPFIPS